MQVDARFEQIFDYYLASPLHVWLMRYWTTQLLQGYVFSTAVER